MAARFHRSIPLGWGVRLNISKRGIGLSAGPRGARIGINSRGQRTIALCIPGTGIGWRKTFHGKPASHRKGVQLIPCILAARLGNGRNRSYARGVMSMVEDDPKQARAHFTDAFTAQTPSAGFLAAWCDTKTDDANAAEAIAQLQKVLQSRRPLPDPLMQRYIPGHDVPLRLTDEVTAMLPVGDAATRLLLADLLVEAGRLDEALAVLQTVDQEEAVRLKLACIYSREARNEDAVLVTNNMFGDDAITRNTYVYRGLALWRLGGKDAAIEALDVARARGTTPAIRKAAAYWRGVIYAETGQKAKAIREFSEVVAIDTDYADVRERLDALYRPHVALEQASGMPGEPVHSQIIAARTNAGLTRVEVCKRSGIPYKSLWAIEKGMQSPRPETLRKILAACGLVAMLALGAACSSPTVPVAVTTIHVDLNHYGAPETATVSAHGIRIVDEARHTVFDTFSVGYTEPISDTRVSGETIEVTAQWRVGHLIDQPFHYTIGRDRFTGDVAVLSDDRPGIGLWLAYDDTDRLTVTSTIAEIDTVRAGDVISASTLATLLDAPRESRPVITVLRNGRAVPAELIIGSWGASGRQSSFGWTLRSARDGVQVLGVDAHGPAARAGVKPGDRILAVDQMPVIEARDIMLAMVRNQTRAHLVTLASGKNSKLVEVRPLENYLYADTTGILSL